MSCINFLFIAQVLLQELSGISFLKLAILLIIVIIFGNFSKKHLVLVQMHEYMEKA